MGRRCGSGSGHEVLSGESGVPLLRRGVFDRSVSRRYLLSRSITEDLIVGADAGFHSPTGLMATSVLLRDVPSKRYTQVGATGDRCFSLKGAQAIGRGGIVCKGFMQ